MINTTTSDSSTFSDEDIIIKGYVIKREEMLKIMSILLRDSLTATTKIHRKESKELHQKLKDKFYSL